MSARFAAFLRRLADRIDHAGAPKLTHWSFTFEIGRGLVFRDDGRGCRVAYLGDDEFGRAHEESDTMSDMRWPLSRRPRRSAARGRIEP